MVAVITPAGLLSIKYSISEKAIIMPSTAMTSLFSSILISEAFTTSPLTVIRPFFAISFMTLRLATLISTRNLSSRFMYNPRLRSFIWDVSKLHPSPAREIFILYLSVIVLTPAKRIAVNHYKLNGTVTGNTAFIDLYGFTLEVTYNGII